MPDCTVSNTQLWGWFPPPGMPGVRLGGEQRVALVPLELARVQPWYCLVQTEPPLKPWLRSRGEWGVHAACPRALAAYFLPYKPAELLGGWEADILAWYSGVNHHEPCGALSLRLPAWYSWVSGSRDALLPVPAVAAPQAGWHEHGLAAKQGTSVPVKVLCPYCPGKGRPGCVEISTGVLPLCRLFWHPSCKVQD